MTLTCIVRLMDDLWLLVLAVLWRQLAPTVQELADFGTINQMAFPIKVCAICSEEFELKPGKPGFANRCPECSEPEPADSGSKLPMDAIERKAQAEANEARREAMKNLLYRKDS